jgi:hypothetical protein
MLNAECTSLVPYSLTILENVRLSLSTPEQTLFSHARQNQTISLSHALERFLFLSYFFFVVPAQLEPKDIIHMLALDVL